MAAGDAGLTRREMIAIGGAGAAALALGGLAVRYTLSGPDDPPEGDLPAGAAAPFALGVASGDPTPTSVILWTRLAMDAQGTLPDGLFIGGGAVAEVQWQVSQDESFARPVASGRARATSDTGYTVHVDAEGLEPGREYFYRFRAFGETTQPARTRTLPPPGSSPQVYRFAFSSCQSWTNGYYPSHAALARDDVDLVFWLGDYIYEGGSGPLSVRRHTEPEVAGGGLTTLADFRARYAQYHSDPQLQAAHAAHPWVVTWDDHEVQDNYAGLLPGPAGRRAGMTEAEFLALRTAAYQAWWENMPVRAAPPDSDGAMRIHRTFDVGSLIRFYLLDLRQYRLNPPADGGAAGLPSAGATNVDGSITGQEQEDWFLDRALASDRRWNVIAQSVVVAPTMVGPVVNLDQWDGFGPQRERILRALADVENPVFLSGDVHTTWLNVLSYDMTDEETRAATAVASEIVAPSTSSDPPTGYVVSVSASNLVTNPGVRYFEGNRRGYTRCVVTEEEMTATPVFAESVRSPDEPVSDGPTYVITAGDPEIRPA